MEDTPHKILKKYLQTLPEIPAQRTALWYEQRKTTVGGSEISVLLGHNPFTTRKQLMSRKLGMDEFKGNIYTQWGTVFEEQTQEWSEAILKMDDKIYETGSLEGKIAGQRYSPDGLGVVKLIDDQDNIEDYIILFEFKSPSGTSFTKKKIPTCYIDQILTGLLTIDIAEGAIYVSNFYRKCSIEQFNYLGEYDREFHKSDFRARNKGLTPTEPYSLGVIGVYQTDKHKNYVKNFFENPIDNDEDIPLEHLQDSDMEFLYNNKFLDLGKASRYVITRLFELQASGHIQFKSYKMIINYSRANKHKFLEEFNIYHDTKRKSPQSYLTNRIDGFKKYCKKKKCHPIGILPWKLMACQMEIVQEDEDWEDTIREPIETFLEELFTIQAMEDPQNSFVEKYCISDDMVEIDDMSDITGGMNIGDIEL